ncbi:collagen-like protein [Acidocella sp.]|uniref:collagen-like protein n=1 Tax=Acidocella sp. TaxID=50710 RepID=UPI003D034F69
MTTIAQLPAASSVGEGDLLPLSQAGLVYSVTVAGLRSGLQSTINVPSGALLGRVSVGTGGPEAVSVGDGLAIESGALMATGADHAEFPIQAALGLSDDVVINTQNGPGLLPMTALRGLFSAGEGISIDSNGIVTVTVSAVAGPVGPQGPAGPQGNAGPAGPTGPAGVGLEGPAVSNSTGNVSAGDYVPLWQNGALAWVPYGQFLSGQTIDQLPASAPVADSDELLVAQSGNMLSTQSFGAVWTYIRNKLSTVLAGVVELTGDTILDATVHNNRLLVASQPLTLTADFENMGSGFVCELINLSAGAVTMGAGIMSGSGGTVLPPGGETKLSGISYSGGSLVWWSGIIPNAPTITVGQIAAPVVGSAFVVGGGIFNDAPLALDYSTDDGTSWVAVSDPVISANAYSFTASGLVAGTYTVRVRDHANEAVIGVSNSFTVLAPEVTITALPSVIMANAALNITGMVVPSGSQVRIGLSSSATVAPTSWVSTTVNGGTWAGSVTPAGTGTFYLWAEQVNDTSVQAVSSAMSAVQASLSISVSSTGTVGTALAVTGNVTPVSDTVNIQLSASNSTVPTSGWTVATNSSGNLSGSLTPSAAGTYYVWAQDSTSGLNAVSDAVTVAAASSVAYGINNPGGSYAHGSGTIPLNGSVTPAQAVATQLSLSTSNTVTPTSGWQAASIIDSNTLWAVYYNTPASAGNYYVWVQTTAGASTTVSSFTISVT